jgi:hypothetical protein
MKMKHQNNLLMIWLAPKTLCDPGLQRSAECAISKDRWIASEGRHGVTFLPIPDEGAEREARGLYDGEHEMV